MFARYENYLEINPAFESVVDIDADQRNQHLWEEYIVGQDMDKLVDYLCQSLGNEAPDSRRSFWIHGTYGTGKSYAAIFVKHLMEEKPEIVDAFLAKNNRLSKYRNRFAKCRRGGDYLVVWKTGCTGIRSGDMMLIEAEKAIYDALIRKFGDQAYLGSGSLMDAVKEKLADPAINWDYMIKTTTLSDDYTTADELRQLVGSGDLKAIKAIANVIRQKGYGMVNNLDTFKKWIADVIEGNHLEKSGIFFIWDEFTEYVEHSDDHTVMQQISEYCKVKPFFMMYVVHRSQEMLDSMGKERYQTITHRFHEVEFYLSPDASLDLIAGSINVRTGMEENWKEARKQVIKNIQPFLPDMMSGVADQMADRIHDLCPIHPMTIRLLSRVAENYAAAERTMFRFMKDQKNADVGFVHYIRNFGPDDQACWLTPDWLWDYFFTRESDFRDKDTKVAEYIRHYEEYRHLVESDANAHRVFKTVMLLLAVMSSTKGFFSGAKANGGLSATVDCLESCLAGVMSRAQVKDLLSTLEDCKMLVLDTAANGTVRLQLPFSTGKDDFNLHYEANEKKYSRYQMFSKDGVFAQEFERMAWDENDAVGKRMKICVCCAETTSIKARLEEIQKELFKFPYKLGLLIVTVKDDMQYIAIQSDLQQRAVKAEEPRLTIALVKNPLTDDQRKKWLNAITKQEMATASGSTGSAGQANMEARTIVISWASSSVSGSKIIAWNGTQTFNNQYGMANLRKTIELNVLQPLFPYAPENIVVTTTAYKSCNDSAPLAGIQRTTANSQLRSVLNGMQNLLALNTIDEVAEASGGRSSEAVGQLARTIRAEMLSGQKVVLSDLWMKLQQAPFGYYDTIACGILLGYVFSFYKNSAYSWTDSAQSTHVLGENTLKTMVLNMVKGKLSTDYLSCGSITFQKFRDYAKAIMKLSDVQVANETECWHNMREAVTKTGTPFWALKYLPDSHYGSEDLRQAALKIVDQMQLFIAQEGDRESIMSEVLQLFNGRGKLRVALTNAFQDKHVMNASFRFFLFQSSPELKEIADKLAIQPEELSDKLHIVMQNAIYTWTEDQVKDKLEDVVSEYRYLDAINGTLGKVYHSIEDAKKDLANIFRFVRIPLAAVEALKKPWFPALQILYKVSRGEAAHMSVSERAVEAEILRRYGSAAMDFLKDGKTVLADILEAENLDCTPQELESVYSGLNGITFDASKTQFDAELKRQIGKISLARNRILLQERWYALTGTESVKDWCAQHSAPLLWVVPKEYNPAFSTLINIQKNQRVLDQDVKNALDALKTIDSDILTDDRKIREAFLNTVGTEYRDIFETDRDIILTKAKLQLGNDMSAWGVYGVNSLQKLLKQAQQEKAKREKLETAKQNVHGMAEAKLRSKVAAFLDVHPEYSDSFME